VLGLRLARTMGLVVAGALGTSLLAGCGGGLTTSSSCSDYLAASSADQNAVVTQLIQGSGLPAGSNLVNGDRALLATFCGNTPSNTVQQAYDLITSPNP
jgi:hypothetical protein